ncbi:MAG: hypothetical protein WBL45_07380 [Solirubrobacterales bacterium]
MIGRRAIVGLSLLCALTCCALAASSAMAVQGTTAFTCKPEPKPGAGTKGFEDEHCTKAVEGTKANWVHEEIKPDTKTEVTATNNETTTKVSPSRLKLAYKEVDIELESDTFQTCAKGTDLENFVESGQMRVEGNLCGEFTKVVLVKKPAGCVLEAENIVIIPTRGYLTSVVKFFAEEKMHVTINPEEESFAHFTLEKCTNAEFDGDYEILGSALANLRQVADPVLDGSTINFTTAFTGLTLEVAGPEGPTSPAKFEGKFTPRMEAVEGKQGNPIAGTTTKS